MRSLSPRQLRALKHLWGVRHCKDSWIQIDGRTARGLKVRGLVLYSISPPRFVLRGIYYATLTKAGGALCAELFTEREN